MAPQRVMEPESAKEHPNESGPYFGRHGSTASCGPHSGPVETDK